MNTQAVAGWLGAVMLALGGIALPAKADTVMHGRVSFADDSALVKGAEDDDWSYADLNSLILPGDTIWADESGAIELEFAQGTFVRLADGSKLDVVDVPPNARFRGWNGSFYVQRMSRSARGVVFETPVGAIDVAPDTQVRVDILEEGATTVSVRWGEVTIHSDVGEPVRVVAGERSYIDPGYLPSEPVVFDRSAEDAFDSWNRDRARDLAVGSQPSPVTESQEGYAPIGSADLNAYGEWIYVDSAWYWRPTVVVDYVPYRRGYWSYVPAQGYVWVGYYPFSYVTSHHGYWHHHARYGWIWSYYPYYAPAYAYTVHYGDMFVWAPLSPYGYPVYYSSYTSFTIGDVYFSFAFSSFCYDRYVLYGHYRPYYVRPVVYSTIYDIHHNHLYHDPTYWKISANPAPYQNAGRPHWPTDRVRTFEPREIYRGPTRTEEGAVSARDRANVLQTRYNRESFAPRVATERSVRTSTQERIRQANVRTARVETRELTEARRLERSAPREAPETGPRVRTFTNEEARRASPLSRGSETRPTVPSERSRGVEPPSRGREIERVPEPGQTRTRTVTPPSTSRTRPEVQRPSQRETAPPSATRPQVTRPETSRPAPSAPSTRERTTRPEVERPNLSRRPSVSSPNVSQPSGRTQTRPEVIRPGGSTRSTVTRPEASRPSAAERPSVTRPSSPSRDTARMTPRTSTPSREYRSVAPPSGRVESRQFTPTPPVTRSNPRSMPEASRGSSLPPTNPRFTPPPSTTSQRNSGANIGPRSTGRSFSAPSSPAPRSSGRSFSAPSSPAPSSRGSTTAPSRSTGGSGGGRSRPR